MNNSLIDAKRRPISSSAAHLPPEKISVASLITQSTLTLAEGRPSNRIAHRLIRNSHVRMRGPKAFRAPPPKIARDDIYESFRSNLLLPLTSESAPVVLRWHLNLGQRSDKAASIRRIKRCIADQTKLKNTLPNQTDPANGEERRCERRKER